MLRLCRARVCVAQTMRMRRPATSLVDLGERRRPQKARNTLQPSVAAHPRASIHPSIHPWPLHHPPIHPPIIDPLLTPYMYLRNLARRAAAPRMQPVTSRPLPSPTLSSLWGILTGRSCAQKPRRAAPTPAAMPPGPHATGPAAAAPAPRVPPPTPPSAGQHRSATKSMERLAVLPARAPSQALPNPPKLVALRCQPSRSLPLRVSRQLTAAVQFAKQRPPSTVRVARRIVRRPLVSRRLPLFAIIFRGLGAELASGTMRHPALTLCIVASSAAFRSQPAMLIHTTDLRTRLSPVCLVCLVCLVVPHCRYGCPCAPAVRTTRRRGYLLYQLREHSPSIAWDALAPRSLPPYSNGYIPFRSERLLHHSTSPKRNTLPVQAYLASSEDLDAVTSQPAC